MKHVQQVEANRRSSKCYQFSARPIVSETHGEISGQHRSLIWVLSACAKKRMARKFNAELPSTRWDMGLPGASLIVFGQFWAHAKLALNHAGDFQGDIYSSLRAMPFLNCLAHSKWNLLRNIIASYSRLCMSLRCRAIYTFGDYSRKHHFQARRAPCGEIRTVLLFSQPCRHWLHFSL